MIYSNRFKLRDLFMNPRLEKIFPQFNENEPHASAQSLKKMRERVKQFVVTALNGCVTGENEITVKGQHKQVLARVKRLAPLLEQTYGNLDKINRHLKTNTKLYTPFKSVAELEGIKTFQKRLFALQAVLDNLTYNPNFQSGSGGSPSYLRAQDEWKKRVNYKE